MNPASTATATADDLAAVIPQKKTLVIAGEAIEIAQIKIGRLPTVLRALQPLQHVLRQEGPFDLAGMFMLYADDCLTLLAALSGRERVWVDRLDIDDAIRLMAVLLEVNLDFFVQRVLPLMPELMRALRAKTDELREMAGRMPSTPSSPTGTGSRTS